MVFNCWTDQAYRQQLYESFEHRVDARMDLIDALLSNATAQSVVALSLSPFFRRQYSSITDAINAAIPPRLDATTARRQQELSLTRLIGPHLPAPQKRPFWLLALDVTLCPRRFVPTLSDRGFVYQPNLIRGNKPITIGHQYEALVLLPELTLPDGPHWVVPLMICRIATAETENQVSAEMFNTVLRDDQLPFHSDLSVLVEDSKYSVANHLGRLFPNDNLVFSEQSCLLLRLSSRPVPAAWPRRSQALRGTLRPQGPSTWGNPDETCRFSHTNQRGCTYTVQIEAWRNLIMHGIREYRMWDKPFTLVRVQLLDENGQLVFKRPMWLIVIGKRRHELSLKVVWHTYRQRYDAEHFFRFGKQRLLFTSYQTPNTEHEETWIQLGQIAYTELWLMRHVAQARLNPWERYLPQSSAGAATPSQVQRDAERILSLIGTPAKPPKPRGNSPGRAAGTHVPHRKRHPVVKKGKKHVQTA